MSIVPLVFHHAPPTYKSIIAQLLMLISALRLINIKIIIALVNLWPQK